MGSSQEFMGYSNQGMLMEKTFHCDIRKVGCVLSEKKVCGMEMYFVKWKNVILIGNALNLRINLGKIDTFTMLCIPTHKHGMHLHLSSSSLISFISVFFLKIILFIYLWLRWVLVSA